MIINDENGYQYTGRIEFLPMGEFTGKGDYYGADLAREKTLKMAIGITADYNNNAFRRRIVDRKYRLASRVAGTKSASRLLADLHLNIKYKMLYCHSAQ